MTHKKAPKTLMPYYGCICSKCGKVYGCQFGDGLCGRKDYSYCNNCIFSSTCELKGIKNREIGLCGECNINKTREGNNAIL